MRELLVCYHGTHLPVKNGQTGVVPHYWMARSMLGRCRWASAGERAALWLLVALLQAAL